MRYEAAEMVEMGQASILILGPKPEFAFMDSEGCLWYHEVLYDVDEVDEQ
jgi:hypothetical protein